MPVDALVLDLDSRGGLAIARSLSRQGLHVAVASRDARSPGLRTRHASARAVLPEPEDDFEGYADAIVALADRFGGGCAVIACNDPSVLALHRRRDALQAPGVGQPEAFEIAISKPRTLALATSLGIGVPRSVEARTPAEVDTAARELGFPVVVKPVESWRDEHHGGERLYPTLARDDAEIAAARRLAPALVQEYAPGLRETIKLFRVGGEVVARFAMRIDRTWPALGGSSVHRESVPLPPDLVERADALLDVVGLDGYSEVEFRRNAAGDPLVMEINPRLSQSIELPIRAGMDFARMEADWARGRDVAPVGSYRLGVRLGWVAGEVLLARTSRPPVGDYLLGRTAIDGLDLSDPMPLLSSVEFAVRRLGTRFRGASRH